ncbi:MAG: hypothetical protein J0I06_03625 [Planctomycetes bacterium]|nr:hypothetical protein [Planctomycetota bacterium]
MFVPVTCTRCGKPFQVPETALGQLAPCPWCQATVTALPVSGPQPDAQPASAVPASEPLSLDDAPAPAQKPLAAMPVAPQTRQRTTSDRVTASEPLAATPVAPPGPEAPPRSRFSAATFAIGFVLVAVVTSATVFVLGYRSGRLPEADWIEFTPPDGTFTVAMPGRPTETEVEPVPEGSLAGGKRYAVRRWYARTEVWIAYNDLEPGLTKKLTSDPSRVFAAGVLRVARDREVARLQGTITKEAEVRRDAGWGVEVHLDAPDGPTVVQLALMAEGPHPRLYVFGIQGKNVTPTSPACRRLFASFRVSG